MAIRIANTVAIQFADLFDDIVNGGAGDGYIEIRTGTQPADPDTAASGTLLATLTFNATGAFGAAADDNPGGKITANAITGDSSADNTGTAGWFRIYDGDDDALLDGSCGTSGTDMVFNTVAITAGDTVDITSMTITMPES